MAAPVVTSITPARGQSVGDSYVTITGSGFNLAAVGSVKVMLDEVGPPGATPSPKALDADKVLVLSPTTVKVLTPGGPVGTSYVFVANVTPQPNAPDLIEWAVNKPAFLYVRPDISTPEDQSNSSIITWIVRQLISDLRRTVLENTWPDMHPEFATAVDATASPQPEAHLATVPSLRLIGPEVTEDRLYTLNGLAEDGTEILEEPVCALLRFEYEGVAETPAEAHLLLEAVTRYLHATPFLRVVVADGTEHFFEMSPEWENRAQFSKQTTRNGLAQFTGRFRIDGVLFRNINTENPTAQVGEAPQVTQLDMEVSRNVPPGEPPPVERVNLFGP